MGRDENRSGEQDAMKEASGTGKGLLRFVEHTADKAAKGAYKAAWKTEHFLLHDENRSGEQDAMKEVSGTGNDGNHSGEQDAMKEVSGTGKGLLRFVEHTVDKAAKGAYKAAWKTEHFLLHDENRSGEQDAMKEVSGSAKPFLRKP